MVIRVLVATGVRAYREGLQRVLQGAEGIALVGIASTAEQTVEQACKLLPSVILLDVGMAKSLALAGQMLGIQRVCGFVLLGKPEAYADVVVCLPAEVVAFVARDATVADFLSAIRAAGGADVALRVTAPSPAVAIPVAVNFTGYLPRNHPSAIANITEREMEILKLIQQGLPNKTISRQLGIELSTVKNHVHSILAKLGAHNRGEAISLLYRYESTERSVPAVPADPEAEAILPIDEQPAVA
jgi:two-component system nitrate/nitrite response regulator NarL